MKKQDKSKEIRLPNGSVIILPKKLNKNRFRGVRRLKIE